MAKQKKTASPNFFKRIALSYRKLPEKKPYIEFITALLTIPVLLTVVLINYNNLKGSNSNNTNEPKSPEKIFVYPTSSEGTQKEDTNIPNPQETVIVTREACKKQLGPVSISSPKEGETLTGSPVSVVVAYDSDEYCNAVWSYRINNGSWSDYDDKSFALYDLPQGNVKLELRVKSVVASDDKTVTRNFVYKGSASGATLAPTGN